MSRNKSKDQHKSHHKLKFDAMHRLDEEEYDDQYPQIGYNESDCQNSDSDISQDESYKNIPNIHSAQPNETTINHNHHNNMDQFKDRSILKSSQYAKQQQRDQSSQRISRKPSIENIQDQLYTQIQKKIKLKDSMTSVLISPEESKSRIDDINISKMNPIFMHQPSIQIQRKTQSSSRQIKQIDNGRNNDSLNQLASKSSMIEAMNLQPELSDIRKKDYEQRRIKEQYQEIIKDRNLTDEQRKVKLDNLNHSLIVDRVKNIIEKTKKMKEQQYKPANRDQKFEMQLNIFKKLDTYLETKGYLQKINSLNSATHKKLINATTKIRVGRAFSKKSKNEKPIFTLNKNTYENQEDIPTATYTNIHNILQKTYKYLNSKNSTILSLDQTVGGQFLTNLERKVLGKSINESDYDESSKHSKYKNEEIISTSDNQSDTNAFYNILQYQLQSGYFKQKDENKNKMRNDELSSSIEVSQEDSQVEQGIKAQVAKDKNRQTQTNIELLDDYRKKAKKITKLLLSTSKNILKKNIEETNNAILQARRARINHQIQQQLNIRYLEKSIKKLPQNLNRIETLQDESSTNPFLSKAMSFESQQKQERDERIEEENERKTLLNQMLPESSLAQKKNIDLQLLTLEKTLSQHQSTALSPDVLKIRSSFEKRFSILNEQKGILPSSKQSIFFNSSQNQQNKQSDPINYFEDIKNNGQNNINNNDENNKSQIKIQNDVCYSSFNQSDKNQIINLNTALTMQKNLSRDISCGRIRQKTEDTTYSKRSSVQSNFNDSSPIYNPQNSDFILTHRSQKSIQNSNNNNSLLSNYQGSPILNPLTSYNKQPESIKRKQYQNSVDISKNSMVTNKIAQINKEKGFKVMNIKSVINDLRENKNINDPYINKFTSLTNNSYQLNSTKNSSIFSKPILSLQQPRLQSNKKQYSVSHVDTLDPYKQTQYSQQQQYKKQRQTPIKGIKSEINRINYTEPSSKLINKQNEKDSIFLTQNLTEKPKRSLPSLLTANIKNEKGIISTPSKYQKKNEKQSSEILSPYKQKTRKMSQSSGNNINNNINNMNNDNFINNSSSENSKQLEKLMNNITHLKQQFKSEKGQIQKQISEMLQKLESQSDVFQPQPLESLRMCFNDSIPYYSKIYNYDRKALQKIL